MKKKRRHALIHQQNLRHLAVWLLNKLAFNIVAWNVFLRIFMFLSYLVNPEIGTSGAKVFQLMYQNNLVSIGMASVVAFSSWILEDVIFYRYLSRKSLGILFILRIIFIFILLVTVFFAISIYHYHGKLFTNTVEYLFLMKWFFLNKAAIYLFTVGILISSFINFFKTIRLKVGFEMFYRIISGYYRSPREENRIFIFIDLISSTRYAELLGHRRYSAFLQECFKRLGILEIKYRAMQYQIVGDEVVLTWPANKPKNFRIAVNFYYEYMAALNKKSKYFKKEFGIIPNFTASINCGMIMVSEVGIIKSEIAFHGDVLNTAARIQKQCKYHNKQLLVTSMFAENFKNVSSGYKTEWVSKDKLVGKLNPVDIYSIDPAPEND